MNTVKAMEEMESLLDTGRSCVRGAGLSTSNSSSAQRSQRPGAAAWRLLWLVSLLSLFVGCPRAGEQRRLHRWHGYGYSSDIRVYAAADDCAVNAAAELPAGHGILVGHGGTLDLVDESGLRRTLVERHFGTTALMFTPDGRLCAASAYGKLYLWDTDAWQIVSQRRFAAGARCLGFTRDGSKLVVALGKSFHETIAVLHTETLADAPSPVQVAGEKFTVLAYNRYNHLLAVFEDRSSRTDPGGTIRIIDIGSGATRRAFDVTFEPTQLAFAGGRHLIAAYNVWMRIIEWESATIGAPITAKGSITLAPNQSGEQFLVGEGLTVHHPGRLVIRSSTTGKISSQLDHPEPLIPLWFDADRGIVLAGDATNLVRWVLPSSQE